MNWKVLLNKPSFEWTVLGIICAVILFSTIRDTQRGFEMRDGEKHSMINNYYIFTHSFDELTSGGDLYKLHPEAHYDYYKYSPLFALLMAPFAILPDLPGLLFWNLLNFFCVYAGLKLLPGLDRKSVVLILLITAMEMVGSIMNEQSNGLMTGLPLLFLALMERNKPLPAILLIVISVFIKLYSLLFLVFLLFYPKFWRNAVFAVILMFACAVIPALVTGWDHLILLYNSWLELLQMDHEASYGYSVLGILNSWFGLDVNKTALTSVALILMMLPLVRIKSYAHQIYRYHFFSALLIWVIIFNHKAESPAFVVAMTGIALWYVTTFSKTKWDHVLLIFSLLFISIAFSDLTPRSVREGLFYTYALKALPGLVVWLYLIRNLVINDIRYQMPEIRNQK